MIEGPEQLVSRRNGRGTEAAPGLALTAPTEARAAAPVATPAVSHPAGAPAAPGGRRWWPAGAGWEVLALAALAAVVLVSFRQALLAGLVVFEQDTQVFYYPLELWFAEEFKAGRFPLWNPYIFAGYPIFADGEIGLAYPLHLALLRLLPVAQAFLWLRISSVLVAAVGMYAFCRSLRLARWPAGLGALTFSLGSFFLSQQHHENVTRTAAWLPLVLAAIEMALHRAGWRRHVWLTAAAAALAMAALGLHPQMLAMSLLAFASFVGFRVLLGPIGGRNGLPSAPPALPVRVLSRLALMTWIGGYVGGLGLGLAAAQLLPLAEMGAATYRGSQPDYLFATSYALPIQNLVTLIFPYFFRGPESDYWSLWAKWETALYVGIVPLLLGSVAVVLARRREVVYFLVLAVLALWLAFATYAPIDLYGVLWSVPGFSSFRVPGRYAYLFVLAWSVLAAFGLQAMADRPRGTWLGRRLPPARLPFAVLALLAVGATAVVWSMGRLRQSLVADPAGSLAWIQAGYLALRHHAEGIEPSAVYAGLLYSLDLANPRTGFALALLGGALLLAAGLAAAPVRSVRFWQGALAGITALDLLTFGMSFHHARPIGELSQSTPPITFLQHCVLQTAICGVPPALAVDEWRVFTPGPGALPSMEFDRLVPFHIQDIGGYSSLESRRNYAYWTTVRSLQNQLLDLANVRYLAYPARLPTLPSYRLVPFDPERPLLLGGKDTLGGAESFILGGAHGHRLQFVGALTKALEIPQGETVAEITVVPRSGEPAVLGLEAGTDLAEWAYDRPDVAGKAKHARPAEIAFRRPDVSLADGSRYNLYLYYTERDLPRAMEVERIEVRYVHPIGELELYGIGLYDFDTGQTAPVTREMRSKLRLAYQDDEVRILENRAAYPRAYVVPGARTAPPDVSSLSAMLDTPFDPRQEVMLECDGRTPGCRASADPRAERVAASPSAPAPAQPLEVGTDRVVYRGVAPEGGYLVHVANYFPGWRARVDGQEAPIFLANGLFRAIPLPPGEHTVELWYEPVAIAVGLRVTLWAALIAAATLAGAFLAARLQRRRTPLEPAP